MTVRIEALEHIINQLCQMIQDIERYNSHYEKQVAITAYLISIKIVQREIIEAYKNRQLEEG